METASAVLSGCPLKTLEAGSLVSGREPEVPLRLPLRTHEGRHWPTVRGHAHAVPIAPGGEVYVMSN